MIVIKAIGTMRQIDDLGRVAIPKEFRKWLSIKEGDYLELFIEGTNLILKKFYFEDDVINSLQAIVNQAGKSYCDEKMKEIIKTDIEKLIEKLRMGKEA